MESSNFDPSSRTSSDETTAINAFKDPSSIAVPLLLNPAYARSKSMNFDELRNIRFCLKCCALDHTSTTSRAVSYTVFAALTFLVPAVVCLSVHAPSPSVLSFNKLAQLPESGLAAISFFTFAAFFRRYGLRQLLFLDGALRDDSAFVRRRYSCELERAFKQLTYILLPSFAVEVAHKILFFSTVSVYPPLPNVATTAGGVPWNSVAFVATLISWVYRTGVFLLMCVLFRLTCELQILRFEVFYKMFEGEKCVNEARAIYTEHMRIKRQLLVTSHRHRIFIIGSLITISISQLGALLLIFESKAEKNFCNSGDLVVCSAVQLSGFFMCLFGAARITHRAQRVVSIASQWHMLVSSSSSTKASPDEAAAPDQKQMPEEAAAASDEELDRPEADHYASSLIRTSNTNLSTSSSKEALTFQSRQALVTYLQHNGCGITLFGFALDRGLLHTIFAFEMTLVLWILSKVVVLS